MTCCTIWDSHRVLPPPTRIYSDSKSVVDLSVNPVAFKKTKQILRAAEGLRDYVARLVFVLIFLPGKVSCSCSSSCRARLTSLTSSRKRKLTTSLSSSSQLTMLLRRFSPTKGNGRRSAPFLPKILPWSIRRSSGVNSLPSKAHSHVPSSVCVTFTLR